MLGAARFLEFRNSLARHRKALLVLGGSLFLTGLAWSFARLDIRLTDADPRMVLAVIGLGIAAALANAVEQWLAARALTVPYTYGRALQVSCTATLANILPLPGGLLVRGASFANAGARKRDSAHVLALGAALWVLLTMALVLVAVQQSLATQMAASALILATLGITGWAAFRFDALSAVGMLVARLTLIGLTVLRLVAILFMLGVEDGWREAVIYSGASVVGQIVGIIPSGIGLVEAVGAGLAIAIDAAPEAAFLALSINRIVGLGVAGLIVLALSSRGNRDLSGEGSI